MRFGGRSRRRNGIRSGSRYPPAPRTTRYSVAGNAGTPHRQRWQRQWRSRCMNRRTFCAGRGKHRRCKPPPRPAVFSYL
ncbi:hypothetical protein [Klebsiella phage vB_KshKPC-M]|nr:hypothetical protein [Klebsiella phage vB_KshKPC-M]